MNHNGNIRFRELLAKYQSYSDSVPKSKKNKNILAMAIVMRINDIGGRFLEKKYHTEHWVEWSEATALRKVSKRLCQKQVLAANAVKQQQRADVLKKTGISTKIEGTTLQLQHQRADVLKKTGISTKIEGTTLQLKKYFTARANDIIVGQLRVNDMYSQHPGNQRMRNIIQSFVSASSPKQDTTDPCKEIIRRVRNVKGGCRFLKRQGYNYKNAVLVEATDDDMVTSVRVCLAQARKRHEEVAAILLQQRCLSQQRQTQVVKPLVGIYPSAVLCPQILPIAPKIQRTRLTATVFDSMTQSVSLSQQGMRMMSSQPSFGTAPNNKETLPLRPPSSLLLEKCWKNKTSTPPSSLTVASMRYAKTGIAFSRPRSSTVSSFRRCPLPPTLY